jgi:hypothetical protein
VLFSRKDRSDGRSTHVEDGVNEAVGVIDAERVEEAEAVSDGVIDADRDTDIVDDAERPPETDGDGVLVSDALALALVDAEGVEAGVGASAHMGGGAPAVHGTDTVRL